MCSSKQQGVSLFVLARDPAVYVNEYNATVFEYLDHEGLHIARSFARVTSNP
jgi:hypothetical protein